jgi:hypothetical protein
MGCQPTEQPNGVNTAACCEGKVCCNMKITSKCCNPGQICASEGELGGFALCL